LPHVLRFNAGHADLAYADLRGAASLPEDADRHVWLKEFVSGLGLPTRLAELGVAADVLPEIAEKASKDHLAKTNPRPAGPEDYLTLLREAH
ncbi:MAG: iron-containing alcohol dehydrogenase, partial [Boseongicola sp. SB0676_bin_33]|nr:iron-containing alcohol dehydrogenase [Boseongicola sp. SB0676_bin_33]